MICPNQGSTPPCRLCGRVAFRRLFEARAFDAAGERFELARCVQCGLVRSEPVFDDPELGRYYAPAYYGGSERKFTGPAEALTRYASRRRAGAILQRLRALQPREQTDARPVRVVDIGCGRGLLLAAMADRGCECHGIERGEFPADEAAGAIRFHKQRLEDVGFEDGYFDVAVLWHVLEHISQPAELVSETARIVRPGGLLVLAVPNFASLQARLYGPDWFHLDLPRHVQHFTPATLGRCLGQGGFRIVDSSTWSIEQNLYGHLQSALNKLAGFARPNAMYGLLKNHKGFFAKCRLAAWAAAAGLVIPAAVGECALAQLTASGATLSVYAQRR